MKVHRLDHVGIVVDDLPAAKAFFLDFGLEVRGEGELQDALLSRIVGLDGAHTAFVMMGPPDAETNIELITFYAPPDDEERRPAPANRHGLRHIAFPVDDLEGLVARLQGKGVEFFSEIQQYGEQYKLCYCRGPEGIILELAEEIGR